MGLQGQVNLGSFSKWNQELLIVVLLWVVVWCFSFPKEISWNVQAKQVSFFLRSVLHTLSEERREHCQLPIPSTRGKGQWFSEFSFQTRFSSSSVHSAKFSSLIWIFKKYACSKSFIKKTKPKKPQTPNQKYLKTKKKNTPQLEKELLYQILDKWKNISSSQILRGLRGYSVKLN